MLALSDRFARRAASEAGSGRAGLGKAPKLAGEVGEAIQGGLEIFERFEAIGPHGEKRGHAHGTDGAEVQKSFCGAAGGLGPASGPAVGLGELAQGSGAGAAMPQGFMARPEGGEAIRGWFAGPALPSAVIGGGKNGSALGEGFESVSRDDHGAGATGIEIPFGVPSEVQRAVAAAAGFGGFGIGSADGVLAGFRVKRAKLEVGREKSLDKFAPCALLGIEVKRVGGENGQKEALGAGFGQELLRNFLAFEAGEGRSFGAVPVALQKGSGLLGEFEVSLVSVVMAASPWLIAEGVRAGFCQLAPAQDFGFWR